MAPPRPQRERWLTVEPHKAQMGTPGGHRPGGADDLGGEPAVLGTAQLIIPLPCHHTPHASTRARTGCGLEAARARGRIGGQKAKLGPRQVKLAWQMYEEDSKRKYTVQQIADEFGVTRPTIYRHLANATRKS